MEIDKDIVEQIRRIISDKPLSYFTIIKNNQTLNSYVSQWTDSFLKDYKFSTKCWYVLNGFKSFVRCKVCGKELHRNIDSINLPHMDYCSMDCVHKSKEVHKKISDSLNNLSDEQWKIKNDLSRQTKLERYGDKNFNNREKYRKWCQQHYGVDNLFQVDDIIKKSIESKRKNGMWTKEWYKKQCELSLKTKGYCWVTQTPERIKKFQNTVSKKTKQEWDTISVKKQKTYCSHSGYSFPGQNPEIQRKTRTPYLYNNIFFKNTWELSYYIFLTDNNIQFEYQPNVSFVYIAKDNKERHYIPDFKVGNEFIELKGNQFFVNKDPTKQMVNPYDKSHKTDYIYEAKHQCMIKNNVKILTKEDMKPILQYVYQRYGRNYLNNFKKVNIY